MGSEAEDKKVTRKEADRLKRRAAYLRAKEQRANDPRQLARKEAARQYRRDAYQAAKERKKGATVAQKTKGKGDEAQAPAPRRTPALKPWATVTRKPE